MAQLVFSQFEAVVETAVNPEIEDQFSQARTLYNRFHKGKAIPTNGRGYRIPFYDRPPASDAFMGEGGQFPVADNPKFNDMRIFHARYATSFLISGDVLANIGEDALIDRVSDLFLLQTDAAKKTLDFQVAGSRTGRIAVLKTVSSGTPGSFVCASTVADGDTNGSFKIKDGARLNAYNPANNAVRSGTSIVNDPGGNNRSTNTVSCDTVNAAWQVGDYVSYEGSGAQAPVGLRDIVNNDTGEIQGQLRSSHPYLKSIALNASAQRLQVALLVEVHYSLRYRTDNPTDTLILTSPTQIAAFMSNGYNLQRFDGGGGTLRMDFKGVQFGDTNWEDHVAIDPDRAYGINPGDIDIYELRKFGAYAEDGNTFRMFTSGGNYFHQWIGFIGAMFTLGAKRFGSHWLLHNLDITNLPGPGVAFA